MAPHDTNTPREAKRHAVPLIAMAVILIVVLVGFLWWISHAMQGPDDVEANPVEVPQATEPAQPTN